MKKSVVAFVVMLALIAGSASAWAASKSTQLIWAGNQYEDEAWTGVNVTTVDGQKLSTKRLFKEQAYYAKASGDWVYFLRFNPDEEIVIGNIYKMKKDGSKLTQLTKDNKAGRFFIEGNSIYYDAYDADYKSHIYVMNLDGKGAKISVKNIDFWDYTISKGFVYWPADGKLYSMKVNGTGKKALSSASVSDYAAFGDTVFYSEPGDKETKSYLVDATGKNKVKLPEKGSVRSVALQGQWFFYETNDVNAKDGTVSRNLVKVKRDGTGRKTVASLSPDDGLVGATDNGFVYKTPDSKLYLVTADGKKTKPDK